MNNPSPQLKAIIAYFTFIGWFIAISMNQHPNKNTFVQWHIRNMFGLLILLFIAIALNNYVGMYLYWLSSILWLYSFIMAIMEKQKGIPFLSQKFNEWFQFIG